MKVREIICNGNDLLNGFQKYNDLHNCIPSIGDIISIGKWSDKIKSNGGKYAEESKLYIVTKRIFDVVKDYNGCTKTDVVLYVDELTN